MNGSLILGSFCDLLWLFAICLFDWFFLQTFNTFTSLKLLNSCSGLSHSQYCRPRSPVPCAAPLLIGSPRSCQGYERDPTVFSLEYKCTYNLNLVVKLPWEYKCAFNLNLVVTSRTTMGNMRPSPKSLNNTALSSLTTQYILFHTGVLN